MPGRAEAGQRDHPRMQKLCDAAQHGAGDGRARSAQTPRASAL
jgi:hypothetical protein